MEDTLDDVAFLANSANRVTILEALVESPRTRYELEEQLGVSRATITRVLRDLEARHWIRRTGRECEGTPLGAWVCEEFTDLLHTMETERRLRAVMRWFPTEEVAFDIRWLEDAEIVHATESDPTAPIRRAVTQLRDGDRIRILSTQVTQSFFDTLWDVVVSGDKTLEGVATPGVYDTVANDPGMASAFRDMRSVENATFFVADQIPLILHVVDDSVAIGLTDEEGTPRAGIFSDADCVRSWAVDTFETYRGQAEPITS